VLRQRVGTPRRSPWPATLGWRTEDPSHIGSDLRPHPLTSSWALWLSAKPFRRHRNKLVSARRNAVDPEGTRVRMSAQRWDSVIRTGAARDDANRAGAPKPTGQHRLRVLVTSTLGSYATAVDENSGGWGRSVAKLLTQTASDLVGR
jgi:hypothetical protein